MHSPVQPRLTARLPGGGRMPNFASVWEGIADALPDADAAAHGPARRTWREWEHRAAMLAGALDAHGVGADDKVALYLYNGFEYLEAQFAAFKNASVPCNVNYRYLADELAYLLENADAKVVFFDHTLAERVDEVRGSLPGTDAAGAGGRRRAARGRGRLRRPARVGRSRAASASAPARSSGSSTRGGTTGNPKAVDVAPWRADGQHGRALRRARAVRSPPRSTRRSRQPSEIHGASAGHPSARGGAAHARHVGHLVAADPHPRRDGGHAAGPTLRRRRAVGHGGRPPAHVAHDRGRRLRQADARGPRTTAEAAGSPYDLSSLYRSSRRG